MSKSGLYAHFGSKEQLQLATIEVAPPLVAFNMERTASEQGKDTELFCKVQVVTPFEGSAKVTLIGLPPNVTTTEMNITKDTKEFGFKLAVPKTAPAGQQRSLLHSLPAGQPAPGPRHWLRCS